MMFFKEAIEVPKMTIEIKILHYRNAAPTSGRQVYYAIKLSCATYTLYSCRVGIFIHHHRQHNLTPRAMTYKRTSFLIT